MIDIIIKKSPKKTTYAPGEEIDFAGLAIEFDGKDVTDECTTSVEAGSAYPKSEESLDVIVTYQREDGSASTATFQVHRKKKSPLLPMFLCVGIAGLAAALFLFANQQKEPEFPQGDTGAYIIPQGEMTDEEAQAMLDEMTEKSRITISVSPEMQLKSDGSLRVNVVVPEENNGFSERLEVEQDGKVVYRSGVIEPGYRLEWGNDSTAHVGPATATIYAVTDGGDFGNPTSVEVEIVEANE